MRARKFAILTLLCLPLLGACSYAGPKSLRASRPLYNQALAQTSDQELLLNLVRLRYRDTPYFTSVERIASSVDMNMSIGAVGNLSITSSAAPSNTIGRVLNLGPGAIALNEKPTIFYVPLEGEKFVRQMLMPINADLLLLLIRSGWSIDRVLRIGVLEMNGLKNAPTASGPAPSFAPEFREFGEAVRALRVLQRENRLDIGWADDKESIELRFTRGAATSDEAMRFKRLAGLALDGTAIRLRVASQTSDSTTLALTTRPVMASLHYLATGIDVPAADIVAGKVRQTVGGDGSPFDWQEMLDGLFRVRVSADEPEDASVKVAYRGAWFYIPDNDLEGKSTFVLLSQIIALHSAPSSSISPLTYSISK
jgi:hypothetical protein